MPRPVYGATPAEWEAFASLNLVDLLPTVCDPAIRRVPTSNNTSALAKIPSNIDKRDYGYGLLGWPTLRTTSVVDWKADDRLGVCIIARTLFAIDIDIKGIEEGVYAEGLIREHLGIAGMQLPVRTRAETGSRLMMFRLSDAPEYLKKTSVLCPGVGAIEFLFHKQHFCVAGTHPSGHRLEWPDGIPTSLEDVPAITMEELTGLIRYLGNEYGSVNDDGISSTATVVGDRDSSQVDSDDPMVAFLVAKGLVRAWRNDGKIDVYCPWRDMHKTPSPDNVTEATFFPIGLGDVKDHPGFRCLHTNTCNHQNWQTFLSKIGYEDEVFDIVPAQPGAPKTPRPLFTYKGKSSVIESNLPNITAALRWPDGFGYMLRYDKFKDAIVYHGVNEATWRMLDDDTYTTFRLRLSEMGMETTVSKEHVRDVVSLVAREGTVDTAQEWLSSLRWDGKPRLAHFHTTVLGVEDTPYHRGVCSYLWTALAGRIMDPGCKADMVPIFIGKQGMRKSSLVEVIVPSHDEFAAVSLANRDADLARQLRGKMIAEWDELRGLNTRDAEGIKGWVSHRTDEWVPKFKEHATTRSRRFIVVGTANETQILSDPTGARRFLPVRILRAIDTEYVERERDQLWAEALLWWQDSGVRWQEAEKLAQQAHYLSTVRDLWEPAIRGWLRAQGNREGWDSLQLLSGACSIPVSQANRASYERLRRVMIRLEWEENDNGKWYCNLV